MPIARRFDNFTLNVSKDDVPALIEVATEDETTNNLKPSDPYNVAWAYAIGSPRLGNPRDVTSRGTDLSTEEFQKFLEDFQLGWEVTVEGKAVDVADTAKFPSAQLGHDTPNIGSLIDPEEKIDNTVSGKIPSEEALFGDSTLAETAPLKDTAKFKGFIACDQVWETEVDPGPPIDL